MKKSTIEIMHDELKRYPETDSGRIGKVFETATRSYIMQRRQKGIKAQGKTDIRFTKDGLRYDCEIKIACGEIDLTTPYKYLVYCPNVDINQKAETQGYVLSREEWLDFVNGYPGRGSFVRVDKKRGHLHIQSFYVSESVRPKASKPIAKYIADTMANKPTVEEYFNK